MLAERAFFCLGQWNVRMMRILLQKSTENKAEKMAQITEKVDVCVIGAGHAGCEAALACARMGLETVIFTVSVESIALMPCNPNIGGSSKGHLVRELDALGGEMGKNIDHTFIQSKMLNASKGPAVHSLRAQADKAEYSRRMRQILENQEHLVIKQAEVCDLLWDDVDSDTVSEKAGATKKNPWCADIYGNGIRSQSGYFVYRNLLKGTLPVRRIHHLYRAERTAGGKSPDRQPERNGHCDAPFQDGNACENG